MTLIQLKYYQVVCQLGSFTKAAKQLSVSQPAISISIKELEAELGVQLLYRDGKIARMTEAGQILLVQCDSLLRHADNVVQLMSDVAKQRKTFRLGITPALAMAVLPQLYHEFVQQNPDIHLIVTEGSRSSLCNQMDQHQLDAILVNSFSTLELTYPKAHIATFEYHFCVAPNHPLAQCSRLSIEEIGKSPLVCFGQGYQQIQFLQQIFGEYGLEPNIVYESSHLTTISGMVRYNGLGTFLYRALSSQWPDLRFIPIEPPIEASISLFWHRDSTNYDKIRKLIQCATNLQL